MLKWSVTIKKRSQILINKYLFSKKTKIINNKHLIFTLHSKLVLIKRQLKEKCLICYLQLIVTLLPHSKALDSINYLFLPLEKMPTSMNYPFLQLERRKILKNLTFLKNLWVLLTRCGNIMNLSLKWQVKGGSKESNN